MNKKAQENDPELEKEEPVQSKQELVQKQKKLLKNQKSLESLIKITAFFAIIGFIISLILLTGITGAAVGKSKENYLGFSFVIIFLFIWTITGIVLSGLKRKENKEKIEIKKLIKERGWE
jgi:hypothetical protein